MFNKAIIWNVETICAFPLISSPPPRKTQSSAADVNPHQIFILLKESMHGVNVFLAFLLITFVLRARPKVERPPSNLSKTFQQKSEPRIGVKKWPLIRFALHLSLFPRSPSYTIVAILKPKEFSGWPMCDQRPVMHKSGHNMCSPSSLQGFLS